MIRHQSGRFLFQTESSTDTVNSTDPIVPSQNELSISAPTFTTPENAISDTTVTSQEIAEWVDRKSRIIFPVLFIIFNILYWVFVLI
jgi:hypothetical protein